MSMRKDIMDACPPEFNTTLGNFIDDVELRVSNILVNLCVTSLDDLSSIVEAKAEADTLAEELY